MQRQDRARSKPAPRRCLPRLGAASKILQADLGGEPWSVCSLEDMEKRICAGHHFLGVVANIFVDLKQWAMGGQEVPLIEGATYA